MSNLSAPEFDASSVLRNRPWFEKAIAAVAPNYALKRLEAQVQRELFQYNASITNRIYAPKTYGQPSESSQTTRSRIVMMWEARELVENVPQARAVSRKFGQYLTPHEYSPTTGDKKYNEVVDSYFHEWCKNCDISGRHSFKKLVQMAAEQRPVDGDCGFAIRRVNEQLKIQLIPATRIGNPNAVGSESDNYFSGVVVDDFGKPVAYRIYRVTREGVYFDPEDIAAENFTHYFDPFRIDQMRGITDFHCSSRTIRMLNEILEAEKAGVRFASQQAALIFSDRGTANPRNLFQPGPPNVTLPNGQEQQNEFSQVATIRYFGNADRIELMPSRPSNAFEGFIAHLMHEISIGVGIPQGVLFGTEDYSGPSVRAEFAAADRIFARHQGVLKDKVLDPIKNAVLLDGIARGEIAPPPLQEGETHVQALKRAMRGEWRFPAKLTIDVGRESAANMAENRQGAKSLQEIAASEGTDAFARLDQIASEAAYVKELSTKYGVPETAIRMTTQQLPATPVQAAAAGDNIGETAVEVSNASNGSVDSSTANEEAIVESSPSASSEGEQQMGQHITVNFADDSYVPTNEMAANAKRALEVRAKKSPSQRGMTVIGIARARDILNRKSLSEETVRRMKAYFDRHEIDKKGETWSQQGKGWQAWNGWGGDAGRTWAEAIVRKLDKQIGEMSDKDGKIVLKSKTGIGFAMQNLNSSDWLNAIHHLKRQQFISEEKQTEQVKAGFDLPSPSVGEKKDEFVSRCMADPIMTKEFPGQQQRGAVCNAQFKSE